jgi:AcrR family transcriptional regulator
VTPLDDQTEVGYSGRARLPREARRAQLLDAAQQVFVERGYHAAGMDEIADRAGVSKPVLYQHFPGKLDLYLALLDHANEQIVAAVQTALDSTTDNKQRVVATIEAYFEFVSADGAPYRLVFESDLTNDPHVRERTDQVAQRTAAAVARLVREDAGVSEEEALLLAMAIVGMGQSSARYWLGQGSSVPRREAARLVAGLAWRGISALPRTLAAADAANT